MDWFKTVGTSEAIGTKERSALKGYRQTYGRYTRGRLVARLIGLFFLAMQPHCATLSLVPYRFDTVAQTINTIHKGACGSGQSALAGVPFERYRTSVTSSTLAKTSLAVCA